MKKTLMILTWLGLLSFAVIIVIHRLDTLKLMKQDRETIKQLRTEVSILEGGVNELCLIGMEKKYTAIINRCGAGFGGP